MISTPAVGFPEHGRGPYLTFSEALRGAGTPRSRAKNSPPNQHSGFDKVHKGKELS
jgi:hypothetical protein